jgi:CheY-like chemotaxis protein
MLGRVVGEELELLVRPEVRRLTVRMDPGQLEQVLVNLVVNARDAMDGRGRVVLTTSDAPSLSGQVEITVTDDGPGIAPEQLARVFEPFFTTKATGTGLGLSIVNDIVREAGGTVLVDSAPGRGTTFRIRLPGCSERAAETRVLPAPAGNGKRGTVLLVEDEEVLLTAMRLNLMRSGFDVLTAASPAQAVAVAGAHPGRIDLLLTDMTMPGGSGRTLAQRLLAERPELRVLIMSGYSEDVSARDPRHGLWAFIAKPFVFDELIRRIESLLSDPLAADESPARQALGETV